MMMNRRCLAFMFAIAAFAGTPLRAGAQPAAPSADAVKRADLSFKQGVRLYSEKKWSEAEAAFLSAWALNPTFDVAYNLGSAEYQLGKYPAAAEHLSFALRRWPLIGAASSLRKTAQQRLDAARAFVGALTVKVNVAHAEVFVDGQRVGAASLEGEVFVEPGERTVEAKLEGYETAKQVVQADKGAARAVQLTLVARAPKAKVVGELPQPAPVVAPKDESRSGAKKAILVAGAGASGAALLAGVVFTVLSNGKVDDAEAKGGWDPCYGPTTPVPNRCLELHQLRLDAARFANLAFWSFVGAGAVGAGTLAYALVSENRRQPSPQVRIVPVTMAYGGGIVLSGQW
jgi:hypothetical protein